MYTTIKNFIEVTDASNLKKILINIDQIKLVEDNKIHFFNVFMEVIETYKEIKQLIIESEKL
ncbi:MAG: hypothetical protein KKD36_09950 [Bacteroidetes bacterium]|nr:hypothetical protein [Bacteroidota bacterium]